MPADGNPLGPGAFRIPADAGQPPMAQVEDILAVELVSFAAEAVGPTSEMERLVTSRGN